MIRFCSWCGANLGEKEPLDDKRVTHGICDPCYDTAMAGEGPEVHGKTERAICLACGHACAIVGEDQGHGYTERGSHGQTEVRVLGVSHCCGAEFVRVEA